jgi:hypothetical protein
MRLLSASCTLVFAGAIIGPIALSQAGSPSRDTAAQKSKEVGSMVHEGPGKSENERESETKKQELNKANTRAVETSDPLGAAPISAGGVPKTPKVDCPPAGSGSPPLPDCKEGSVSSRP